MGHSIYFPTTFFPSAYSMCTAVTYCFLQDQVLLGKCSFILLIQIHDLLIHLIGYCAFECVASFNTNHRTSIKDKTLCLHRSRPINHMQNTLGALKHGGLGGGCLGLVLEGWWFDLRLGLSWLDENTSWLCRSILQLFKLTALWYCIALHIVLRIHK